MSQGPVDQARAVREGEALDTERLAAFIAERMPEAEGEVEVLQFPGGHSNLTYLVRAGGRELVLRRPPFGTKVKSAHDMGREYRILSRLADVYPKAPRARLYCDDPAVLGAPFYLMDRVEGVILRKQQAPAGVALPPERMRALSEALVDGLAELHGVDFAACGLGDLGHPEGYVRRQVEGWTRRYAAARTDDLPEVERAAAWLLDHVPPERGAALIHNDYKYDNLVLDPADLTRIVAVLDWEMATVGDPLMDLGTSLGYWVDPDDSPEMRMLPVGPTTLPGNLTRAEVVARYAEKSGDDVAGILFYYVFGLFKVAVIAQQIYARFKQGLTQDPRFQAMILGVTVLGKTADRAVEVGRIDRLWG